MTIVNNDSKVINKLEASLIDGARVVIYDRHMFIVQAIGELPIWRTQILQNFFTNENNALFKIGQNLRKIVIWADAVNILQL